MPIFLYKNPQTGEIKEVIQSVHEEHSYFENGIKFERVWTIPHASIDSQLDPTRVDKFVEKTGKMKGNWGNLQDLSKELSEKRAKQSLDSKDPIKEKYFDSYASKHSGRQHYLSGRKQTPIPLKELKKKSKIHSKSS